MNIDQLNGNHAKTVFAAKEPSIYDAALKTVSGAWVDWYMAKHECDVDHALTAAGEVMERMVASIKDVVETSQLFEQVNLLLVESYKGIEDYLRAIRLLKEIGDKGWAAMMSPTDPSIFTTDPDKSNLCRDWLAAFCRDKHIDMGYMAPVANAIVTTSLDIKPEELEKHIPETPALQSSIPGIPSLAWVLRYVATHKVRPTEAHTAGEKAIKEQSIKDGFES